jgi:hypothetical protein
VLVAAGLLLGLPALVDYYGERGSTAGEKAAYRYVAANYREGDVVLHLSKASWAPALFYHDQALAEYFLHGTPSSNVMRYWRREKSELEVAEIGRYQRVWIYRWPQLPPIFDRVLREILNRESFQQLGPRLLFADQDGTLFLFELAGAPRAVPEAALLKPRGRAVRSYDRRGAER